MLVSLLVLLSAVVCAQEFPDGFVFSPPIGDTPSSKGGRIISARYGPYTVEPSGRFVSNSLNIAHPCPLTGCYITAFEGDLEYADGSNANVDTGAWLHHMVVTISTGPKDVVCPTRSRRIFGVGNERTTTRTDSSEDFGVPVTGTDTLRISLELMNESPQPMVLYMTTKMEVTEEKSYKPVDLIWLDACGCCSSSVPAQSGAYQLVTPTWTSSVSGKMLTAGGHAHDGGERVEIFKNGERICVNEMLYAMTPEYVGPATGHHGEEPTKSISNSGWCFDLGRVEVGDELYAVTYYNATKYPQMVHDGTLHPVMGIANIWVGLD